jgi:hypothetical protein
MASPEAAFMFHRATRILKTLCGVGFLWCGGLSFGQSPVPAPSPDVTAIPTWAEEIAHNLIPYHQLKTEDFPKNDKGAAAYAFSLTPFMHYFFNYTIRPGPNGILYAYVSDWTIYSGIDKNQTWRRVSTRELEANLPYAQAVLDLNEIACRQIALLKSVDLPRAEGWSLPEVKGDLKRRADAFVSEKLEAMTAERAKLQRETNFGRDLAKMKKVSAAIRQRLEALPPIPSPTPMGAPASARTPPAKAMLPIPPTPAGSP